MTPVLAQARADRTFERLYKKHVGDVYRYALVVLRNPTDAEDVTQTTFMNAYRAFKRGELPLKPHNWLIKIAHNAARTRYARSTRRVKEVPLDDHVDSLIVPEDEKPDVQEVLEALAHLPLNQRAALVMRELEGRSYADIADTLGVSVAAVETLIFRARRSLKVKASAVRVLGVVQLPPSLAQLFGGGAVVAGGGSAVASGFILKAAVAIVAGAVATGVVGGEQSHLPQGAGVAPAIAAPSWNLGVQALARENAVARTPSRPIHSLPAKKRTVRGKATGHRRHVAADDAGHAGTSKTGGSDVSRPMETPVSATAAASTKAVEQVSNTVGTVTKNVPPLPVSVPQPTLPATPQLPTVTPPLPAVTPQLPAVPSVSPLPPPPLPTLP
jgi:RNA polymerase sigma factor (sigma-70 family)